MVRDLISKQMRVTMPLWAPGADSGQREKNEIGGKIRTENGCNARPWGRQAVIIVYKICLLVDNIGQTASVLRDSAVYARK